MKCTKLFAAALLFAGALAVIGTMAIAEPSQNAASGQDTKAAQPPEMKLPPGMTEEDMKAYAMAATPGKMHQLLAKDVGEWEGQTTMWMGPDSEPIKSECSCKISPMMDGRYIKSEMSGDMPGMGSFSGMGLTGFDNVSQKFVSTWIDNQSTGIMYGTGELSPDGKTLTWKFTYNCPITKKPVAMREIDTNTGPDAKTLEMFGPHPKTGKEYRMMKLEFKRKPGSGRAAQ